MHNLQILPYPTPSKPFVNSNDLMAMPRSQYSPFERVTDEKKQKKTEFLRPLLRKRAMSEPNRIRRNDTEGHRLLAFMCVANLSGSDQQFRR